MAEHLALGPRRSVTVHTLSSEEYETVWGLLDVADQEVEDGHDVEEALITCVAGGADQALRAGLALAFALSEGFLSSTWNAHWSRARAHLTFLERHGNVLSEAERRELDELAHEDRAETPELEPGEYALHARRSDRPRPGSPGRALRFARTG